MEKINEENNKGDNYDARFSGVLGADYNLCALSIPHYYELQNTVKNVLKDFFAARNDLKEINVLEAGSGTGLTTVRILDADPRIKVMAVDNEEKTIRQAEQTLKDLKDRIEFVHKDILSALLEVKDNSLDAFASAFAIHNFTDEYREKVFKEIARVLKGGGLFVNADKYALDDKNAHLESLEKQIKSLDVYDSINRPDVKEGWIKHYYEDEKVKITEGEQKKILLDLGFENIKVIFRKGMEATIMAIKK